MVAFQRLGAALGTALAGEVCFDDATRAAYAAVALCRSHAAAILPRGAGTSMCGQSVNAAVVIDCSKYLDRVLHVDTAASTARVEPGAVCCGRPYYDFCLLERARAKLERVLDTLAPQPRAAQLAKSVTSLSELLNRKGFKPRANGKLLLHAHCHQKALWGTKDDVQLMRKAGVELLMPDTGCCGMAGSFGYRPEFYETSKRIASLALLPALEAAPDATVLASGFSCREQIEALAGRPTLHLAELLARA